MPSPLTADSGADAPLTDTVIEAYLERIGITDQPTVSFAGLAELQRAHLTSVPFENLDVVTGVAVSTDLDHSIDKVIAQRRGGWCFELNGAFGALLESLGFAVVRLGAAVLLDGPNNVIDHLALEVMLDQPYLVDVGFGESFITPLRLNEAAEQDGASGSFQFIGSPQGTTLARTDEGVPVAQYRFKRVAHQLADFIPASDALQADKTLHWSTKPFATRLIDGGPARVTLLKDRLKFHGDGEETEERVSEAQWPAKLREWFGMEPPS